jgi:DNA invertase Pin-like site-specific DNA recombinase
VSNCKITPEHLARDAIVYIRQSTPHQVVNNLESKRRQYGLVEREQALRWNDVQVIDDDLGRSANGDSTRHGFEKLLARICEGRVGIIVSIEASRLARNGREWHTLLEFCGFTNCLIADENQIYDPRQPDDRLVLGMKGAMSEMGLSILHQRWRNQKTKSTPGRVVWNRSHWLSKIRPQSNRERSQSSNPRRHLSCVQQIC